MAAPASSAPRTVRRDGAPGGTRSSVATGRARFLETLIDGFDEHIRRPGSGGCAVPWIVIECRTRGFHLVERFFLLDHRGHTVADDRHHVAVLDDVELVADAPMGGDDKGPAFFVMRRHGEI